MRVLLEDECLSWSPSSSDQGGECNMWNPLFTTVSHFVFGPKDLILDEDLGTSRWIFRVMRCMLPDDAVAQCVSWCEASLILGQGSSGFATTEVNFNRTVSMRVF